VCLVLCLLRFIASSLAFAYPLRIGSNPALVSLTKAFSVSFPILSFFSIEARLVLLSVFLLVGVDAFLVGKGILTLTRLALRVKAVLLLTVTAELRQRLGLSAFRADFCGSIMVHEAYSFVAGPGCYQQRWAVLCRCIIPHPNAL